MSERKVISISVDCFVQSPEFYKLVEFIESVNSASFDLFAYFINDKNSVSENDIEKIDSYRYMAHKILEKMLDSADNRTFNQKELNEIKEYISNKNCSE